MFMKGKIAVVFVLMIFWILFADKMVAQESDSLSSDSEQFFQQVSSILLNTPSKSNQEKSQLVLDRLYARWTIGRFNKEEKDAVRNLVETMRKKKLKSYPYLYNYVYSLMLLSESHQTPKSIIGWHAYAEKLLSGTKSSRFNDFTDFTIDLFEHDRLDFQRSVSWYHRQSKFKFELDTNFLVRFEQLSLVCATKKDSSTIIGTQGVFNYDRKLWNGKNGTIKWSRFGDENEDKIFAELQNYSIDVTKTTYIADSAVLHYERFFKNPVLGTFTEKVMSSPPGKRTSYPRFESYRDDFELVDIYPNLNYYGGFSLKGMKLFGRSGEFNEAFITLSYDNNNFGIARSELFTLDEEKLESQKAEVVFYFEKDSLYHPGLRLKYNAENSEMQLLSDQQGADMIPFFDSYHQLDIYSPGLFWSLDSTEMYFKRVLGVHNENIAAFVSSNYFSERDFYAIQGIDELNPMYVLQNYLKTYNDKVIQLNSLASFMKKPTEQVSAMLINLSNNGFVVYNPREKTAIVKDRFFDFLNAKSGRSDYDIIRLESKVNRQANAKIDLQSLSLDVFGVPEVILSDSQQVYIYPYDNSISFKKNRDFAFDGQVHMGLFDFYSRSNTFVYDSFMINMNYIDSLAFRVYSTDSLERIDSVIKVKNIIAKLNGKIYIDMPFNKSGLKQFPEYPIFVSDESSYVYFNEPYIQDSTLLAESFYYRIDPFQFDSIKTFSTAGMQFNGTLVSAGIFPPIQQPLTVMPDYSLGFVHLTPEDGYPIYGGKGTFTDSIFLSNNGFAGSGKLDYLASKTISDNYVFYPDSLTAEAFDFKNLESPTEYDFPFASADTVNLRWLVDTNVMLVDNPVDSFLMYRNAKFNGDLTLSPANMYGKGAFHFEESEIRSKNFNYNYSKLSADSADFFLRKDVDTLVFQSHGYFAKVDFEQQRAWFTHSYENTFVEFPYNKYISNLDEVEWIMDEDKIELFSDLSTNYQALDTLNDLELIDYKLKGPEFISIDQDPDSITRFFAGKATYNLNTFTIDVENVKLIKSADAAIFPNNEYVQILRDGGLLTLHNARIIADTLNKYHYIYDAEVDILNRHRYLASGFIDYVDLNKTKQPIYLIRIEVDGNGVTTGFGDLEPTEIFFLSPEYFFTGQIGLKANNEFLHFSGGYRINEDCVGQEDKWVSFEKYLDPNNIYFDINENSRDLNQQLARFGLAYSKDSKNFYPLILQPTESPNDDVLIEAKGQINYDTASQSFRVGSGIFDEKGVSDDNFVALNTERCILNGDGVFDFGLGFDMINITSAGKFRYLVIPDSTYINSAMLMNFHFDEGALNMMIDSLRLVNSVVKNPSEGNFPLFLRKVLGSQRSAKLVTEISLYGQMERVPKALEHTLIFSELNMKWDRVSNSFISQGPIGIGYIAGMPVNKYVDGYIQIEKGRNSSSINIYLQLNSEQWYFFSYQHGIMQVMSSDNAFNDYISLLKPAKRVLNPDSDTDYYEFVISTRRKVIDFLRKMEKIEKR